MSIVFYLRNATTSLFSPFLSASRQLLYGLVRKTERGRTNNLLVNSELDSSLELPSGNISGNIIEREKTTEETESELIEMEDYFRASLDDLFDDYYAEIIYVICPKKWLQPNGR